MKRFLNSLSTIRNRPIVEAARHAYKALFEAGLSPQKKTRRAIRTILPEPPGGWDSPAKKSNGEDFVSRNGNVLTWDQVLETFLRGLIFRDNAIAPKFEPGVARIAYTELGIWPEDVEDFRPSQPAAVPLGQFRSILHMLSGDAHVNEYDFDLNGMHYDEMVRRFGKRSSDAEVDDTEDSGKLNYNIVHIPDFYAAREYGKYTNRWCLCEDISYFNRYTARGKNTFYILFAPGFEDLKMSEHGEGYPHDRYALSMIGAIIAPDGSLEYCCLRRNHDAHMSDHELTEKELSGLLGRPMRTVLPYIDNSEERNKSLTERIKERMAKGATTLIEIYGDPTGRSLWGNLAMFDTRDYHSVLVDTSTNLPVIDHEIANWWWLDDRAIYADMIVGTDEYDDDRILTILIRSDGMFFPLGSNDDEDQEEWNPLFYDAIRLVEKTGINGVYRVVLNTYDSSYDQEVIYLPENDEPYGITRLHSDIQVFGADGIIVCDPGEEETDFNDDGGQELIQVSPDGNIKRFDPVKMAVYADDLPDGKANVIYYEAYAGKLHMIHDGVDTYTGIDVEDFDYIDKRLYPAMIRLEYASDERYGIFSMRSCTMLADNLPEYPDDTGVFTQADGKKNMVTEEGLLLENGADRLKVLGSINSPIGLKGRYRHSMFVEIGSTEGDYFVNLRSGEKLYDVPVPPGSCPYTENLYIKQLGYNGGNPVLAMFNLAGQQTSCEFARLSDNMYEMIERPDGKYNLIDPDTGKEIFAEWLPERPYFIGCAFDKGELTIGKLVCTRADKKSTILYAVTPVSHDEFDNRMIVGYTRFKLSDLGWHDHFEQVRGANSVVIVGESTTGENPCPPDKYMAMAIDLRTGAHTAVCPGPVLQEALVALANKHGFDDPSTGVGWAIAKCPNWAELADKYIKTGSMRDSKPRNGETE